MEIKLYIRNTEDRFRRYIGTDSPVGAARLADSLTEINGETILLTSWQWFDDEEANEAGIEIIYELET